MAKRKSKKATQQLLCEPWLGHKVPLRPLDPDLSEMGTLLDKETHWLIQRCVGDPVHTMAGVRSFDTNWKPDPGGMAKFRAVVRELLIDKGHNKEEELRRLTIEQILPPLTSAVHKRNERIRKDWREGLLEAYEIGLKYKDSWQQQVREVIASVEQYVESLQRGEQPTRAPLPYMEDNRSLETSLAILRFPDPEDMPWMFFVLGWKLEGLFGVKGVFVPADVHSRLREEARSDSGGVWSIVECSVFDRINGDASLDNFKTWWFHVREDLQAEANEDTLPETQGTLNPVPGSDREDADDSQGHSHKGPVGQGTIAPQNRISTDDEWSRPMSKQTIATALGLSSRDKLTSLAKAGAYQLRQAGNRQTWQIRLRGIAQENRKKLV